jgi:transposase-like protein
MGNRKGQKHYPEHIRQIIVAEQRKGKSVCSLSAKYGVSRYTIQSWCGLRPEVNRRQMAPLKRGRPTNKPEDLEKKVKRLEMENELLRNFLRELERK